MTGFRSYLVGHGHSSTIQILHVCNHSFGCLQKAQRQNVRAMRELIWVKRLSMLRDVAAGMHYLVRCK